jgi:ribonuclease HI
MTDPIKVVAFTDGAAKGNPGPGGWGAVMLLAGASVRELGGAGGRTTNNRMEMMAATAALEWLAASDAAQPMEVLVVTDSTYVLRGVTEWITNWKRRGWKTLQGEDVANRDLWERLESAAAGCLHVRWRHVPGHSGYPGNVRADEIASEFALAHAPKLYSGPYEGYGFDLEHLPVPGEKRPRSAKSSGAKGAAHSYVSLVDGVVLTHSTWAECERRVKGRSGAKFKKTSSAADERSLLREWGGALDDPLAGR